MTPIQQLMLGVGASKKTYLDDVFSTYLYEGNGNSGASQSINNGINLSGEGGMIWFKNRTHSSSNHELYDTIRGVTKRLRSNSNETEYTENNTQDLTSFNSNGFSLGAAGWSKMNWPGDDIASWSFRKAKGFFDVVTWTTSNDGSAQRISHNLGCVPGLIIIKSLNQTENWTVYHRDIGRSKILNLNSSAAITNSNNLWDSSDPTSTDFGWNGGVYNGNQAMIAYVFAGGESTAANARSIELDGTNDGIKTSTSTDYDFGTGDFTVEFWIKFHTVTATQQTADHRSSGYSGSAWCNYLDNNSEYKFWMSIDKITGRKLDKEQWYHIANVRHSGTTTLYIDGISQGTYADTNDYSNQRLIFGIHGSDETSFDFDGEYSNIRIVKGTAVYTSSFRPPTAPLTNITNTKFLGANSSSVTGTTVGTAIAVGDPTASTDSPFDDPSGFVFGENKDQGIIKCGSFVGNHTNKPVINLGWEPQFLMWKNADQDQDWFIVDSMRGAVSGGNDARLRPNNTDSENTSQDPFELTPTGFKCTNTDFNINGNGDTTLFIAIRRPDGYVQKPVEDATKVFAMDTGSGSSGIPVFDSGFPVDFAFYRDISTTADWYTNNRLTQGRYLFINKQDADAASSTALYDSNAGFHSHAFGSTTQAFMWKRHAGFDCITHTGNGVAGRQISHSLNAVPEMIWSKPRSNSDHWKVYHKGLNSGTTPEQWFINLNDNGNETQGSNSGAQIWNNEAPTSTHFTVGTDNGTNASGWTYLALLFSSVEGISKVGYYTGSSSDVTITTGFQPRFVIIKRTDDGSYPWMVLDTLRGWDSSNNSGNDPYLRLNQTDAQVNFDNGYTTSTGFVVDAGSAFVNTTGSPSNYIYYAHA